MIYHSPDLFIYFLKTLSNKNLKVVLWKIRTSDILFIYNPLKAQIIFAIFVFFTKTSIALIKWKYEECWMPEYSFHVGKHSPHVVIIDIDDEYYLVVKTTIEFYLVVK